MQSTDPKRRLRVWTPGEHRELTEGSKMVKSSQSNSGAWEKLNNTRMNHSVKTRTQELKIYKEMTQIRETTTENSQTRVLTSWPAKLSLTSIFSFWTMLVNPSKSEYVGNKEIKRKLVFMTSCVPCDGWQISQGELSCDVSWVGHSMIRLFIRFSPQCKITQVFRSEWINLLGCVFVCVHICKLGWLNGDLFDWLIYVLIFLHLKF